MYSTIYWITRLDSIQALLITVIVFFALPLLFAGIAYASVHGVYDKDDEEYINANKRFDLAKKWAIRVVIPAALILTFLPSKNEMILIYAGGKAYEYVQSDTSLQKLPYQTTEYLKLVFQKEIDELKKKEDKE